MDAKIKELHEDVKEIKTDLKAVSLTLERNTASLEHHVKRTDMAEERIKRVETWILGFLGSILLAMLYYFLRA